MAKPQRSYPESATKGGREESTDEGREALEEALGEHGEELAAAVGRTDELDELLTTAILVLASADEEEVEDVTETLSALVRAGDGLATEGTAELAAEIGENADEFVDTLEMALELQQDGDVEQLLETAKVLSVLDIDEDAARGLNSLLSAVGEAERESEPVGLLGALRQLRSRDGRAGLGYLLSLLKGLGRGSRER